MKKTGLTSKLIFIIPVIIFISGCDFLKEEVFTGPLPAMPAECTKFANLLDRSLEGLERAQVSQLQATRASNKLDECLQNEGLSAAQSKAVIKNSVKTFRERPGAGDVKSSDDMFVF